MSLTSLTPDLLGLILAFDCVNYASLPLWLCGCKALQHQLAFGVTTVTLKNAEQLVICRVPPYLEELRHLRHLELCRSKDYVICPWEAVETLRRLNPDIETLRLNFAQSHQFLCSLPPRASGEPPHNTDEPQWTLKAAYPRLQTLSVPDKAEWKAYEVENLPAQLTSLTTMCPRGTDDFKAFMHALPHSLVELDIPDCSGMDIEEILATIPHQSWQTLSIDYPQSIEGISLPPTLTTMRGFNAPPFPSAAFINALPSSLTAYDRIGCEANNPIALNFGHLASLTSLGVGPLRPGPLIDATNIRTLPSCLQKARITSGLDGIKVTDWPHDLVYLELKLSSTKFPVEILPPGLTSLSVESVGALIPMSAISLLPRTLTSLDLDCGGSSENVDFPPALKTLNLNPDEDSVWVDIEPFNIVVADGDSSMEPFDINLPHHMRHMPHRPKVTVCFPFNRLPKSITHLKIPCMVPGSQLKHLPPRLQHLYAIDIFEDSEFDGKSAESIGHMHEVFRIGREESESVDKSIFEVSYEWNLEASMSSLLPRSLVTLSLYGDIMALTMDWPRFPPRLETLALSLFGDICRPIPMDFISVAPFSALNTLKMNMLSLTDSHMMALPRKLKMLVPCNTNTDYAQFTPACVPHTPLGLQYRGVLDHSPDVSTTFEERFYSAFQAYIMCDLTTLRLLQGADGS